MSGDLFMMRLWKYVDTKKLDNKCKANIFLIMNIILWSGIAFLLSFVAGVFCGYSAEWVEWTVIITGYAGTVSYTHLDVYKRQPSNSNLP